MDRIPWTHEELQGLIPKLDKKLSEVEAEQEEEIKPLPPMTTTECLDFFWRFMDIAAERPLTQRECFIHGQLLAIYQQAVLAESMGKKGRYYVIPEESIAKLVKEKDEH